ncbi:MAG: endonuclease/exonuclease/phosphatase family protein [Sedimentisphaerales bacterium]|nr:endonuclease/exonuclease/phosphatase family protein [Sedimentisphaerales bacterium]
MKAKPETNKLSKIKNALSRRGRIVFYASCIFTLTGFLGKYSMAFELTAHFRMQYLFVFLIAVVFWGRYRKWWWLSAAIIVLIINAAVILPWYFAGPDTAVIDGASQIRILLSNVHTSNDNYADLLALVERESPDIIVLEETDRGWVRAVKELEAEYNWAEYFPRADNFGITVFSRIKVNEFSIERFGGSDAPSIIADLEIGGSSVKVIATHLLPPATPSYFRMRNRQLEQIARQAAANENALVVIGDFNLTMWSHYYSKFVADSGLKDARQGFGIEPTWPTMLPPLYIPIDQCFCSKNVKVINFKIGNRIGSDHLPLIVDLAFPEK